jgi:hypothetical protein
MRFSIFLTVMATTLAIATPVAKPEPGLTVLDIKRDAAPFGKRDPESCPCYDGYNACNGVAC